VHQNPCLLQIMLINSYSYHGYQIIVVVIAVTIVTLHLINNNAYIQDPLIIDHLFIMTCVNI